MPQVEALTLGGVPGLIRFPVDRPAERPGPLPIVVLWHGFGLPNSAQSMMDALPLDELPAFKVYPGLPLFGPRLPPGGTDEVFRGLQEDYVLNLFEPAIGGAVAELAPILDELPAAISRVAPGGPKAAASAALVGFSAGGLAPLLAIAERAANVRAAVLINTAPRLADLVPVVERLLPSPYVWSDASRAVAARFDFLARAEEVAADRPGILILHGDSDELIEIGGVRALYDRLLPSYRASGDADRLRFVEIAGLSHNFGSAEPDSPIKASDPDLVRPEVGAWLGAWLR